MPVVGAVYSELLSGHNLLVYVAFACAARVVGDLQDAVRTASARRRGKPAAVDATGISVTALRYEAMVICGVLCGIAGTYLSTTHGAAFVRDMTADEVHRPGAMIFGKWRPCQRCLPACYSVPGRGRGAVAGVSVPGW